MDWLFGKQRRKEVSDGVVFGERSDQVCFATFEGCQLPRSICSRSSWLQLNSIARRVLVPLWQTREIPTVNVHKGVTQDSDALASVPPCASAMKSDQYDSCSHPHAEKIGLHNHHAARFETLSHRVKTRGCASMVKLWSCTLANACVVCACLFTYRSTLCVISTRNVQINSG